MRVSRPSHFITFLFPFFEAKLMPFLFAFSLFEKEPIVNLAKRAKNRKKKKEANVKAILGSDLM